jgi:hypothetical protein
MPPISDLFFESERRRMDRSLFFKWGMGCLSALFLMCVCGLCVGLWFLLPVAGK